VTGVGDHGISGRNRTRANAVGAPVVAGARAGSVRRARVLAFAALFAIVGAMAGCARSHATNVVLITLDTTRADHLGCYGSPRPTPHLDSLAREGIRFAKAYCQVPTTPPSHATILTGLYPWRHGLMRIGDGLPAGVVTLPGLLAGRGYQCAAAVASSVLDRRFGLDRGFSEYLMPEGEELAADVQTRRAGELLERIREPFFLWLHYYDAHLDYVPPPAYRDGFGRDADAARYRGDPVAFRNEVTAPAEESGRRPTDVEARLAEALYDGEIRFTDEQVGRLFGMLKEKRLWDRTVVVVTADHGESFRPEYPFDHGDRLFDEILRVPLLLRVPGGPVGVTVGAAVELTDVAPTILDVLGVPIPSFMDGRSAVPLWRGGTSPREWLFSAAPNRPNHPFSLGTLVGLRGPGRVFINAVDRNEATLYDDGPDGATARDACASDPATCAAYRARVEAFLATYPGVVTPRGNVLDEDLKAKLRGLGYLR
jgi:arylsulfatase A-like enzyme